jgi:phospholipid/cholesterol/gamma-HCH transport system substrate-binding protein
MGVQQDRLTRRTVLLGALGIGFVAIILYIAATAHSGLPFTAATEIKASFKDVHSLREADDVRENGVRTGQVSAIEYKNGEALVTLKLSGHQDIYANAQAYIWDLSALGTKYVELDRGTPESGPLGDKIITSQRTKDSADIYHLLDVFDPVTLAGATSTVRELGVGAAGHGPDFHNYLSHFDQSNMNIGRVSESFASPQADLPALLHSADELSGRFVNHYQQLSQLISRTDDTLRAFATQNAQPLAQTLQKMPATLDSTKSALDRLNPPLADTRSFMTDFRPGAGDLARSEGDLRGTFRDSVTPFDKVPDVSDDAKSPLDDLRDVSSDARPLAPRAEETFDHFGRLLRVLGPYATDLRRLWSHGRTFVNYNIDGKHLPFVVVQPNQRTTGALIRDGLPSNPYARPNEAANDRMGYAPSTYRGDR